ncbi:MAG TPA: prolipoprotein diacylglyceryl transferase [Xanthobacteraceae bacterium]|nr:prolipoprotein diacylglyceryl transferase [Xanthobacteraceae bacterium]
MEFLLIPFPVVDPVAVNIGPLPIRWYALGYIGGLFGGWIYAWALLRNDRLWNGTPRPSPKSLDDLVLYMALGIVIGGRLGDVLFYEPGYYLAHPLEIVEIWNGGMAFHGGLIGALIAMWLFARQVKIPFSIIADICAATCPIGIFLVRIANFIKPELWGRPSDVPWAMIFPGVDDQPRHPSQLYEAGLEGLLLLFVLAIFIRNGALKRPGLVAGVFGIGYAMARIVSEFFREPDLRLEQLSHSLTMGMVLSVPVFAIGVALIVNALYARAAPASHASGT